LPDAPVVKRGIRVIRHGVARYMGFEPRAELLLKGFSLGIKI
jgi:hypothetical protein